MDMFLQQLVNALSLGGTYALLALGLAVVFDHGAHQFRAWRTDDGAAGYGLCFALLFGMPFGARGRLCACRCNRARCC